MTNGEAARGVPRSCRDGLEQAIVEASDDRVQAAADRRDRHALAGPPVHVLAARPAADRDAEGGAARGGGGGEDEGLAFDPDDDQHVRTAHGDGDGYVEDHGDGDGARSRQKGLMQSSTTGLRSKAR